ncbi:hypothetical protein ACTFQF_00665 [Aliivibrio fischeri]|uniref:hypothetical protein n=1 Tax=Aliivibrio fischeri TaxID=668 RepID=UPI0007C458A6|nr:hypothetical protein [Aliivibrio fischeri]MUK37567.1 hypothetical protein [Aliivibrio fischeri]
MSRFNDLNNCKETLVECEFPAANRRVGIRIGFPFFNSCFEQHSCEVDYERPSLNTQTACRITPLDELNTQVISSGESLIEGLDLKIAELVGHRERIALYVEDVKTGKLDIEAMAKEQIALSKKEKEKAT